MTAPKNSDFQDKLEQIASGNLDTFRQTTDEFLNDINSDYSDYTDDEKAAKSTFSPATSLAATAG